MALMKASATALFAAGVFAAGSATVAAGDASGCEWQKQVMAKAAPPPIEDQTATTAPATPVDPVLLARNEKLETQQTEQK